MKKSLNKYMNGTGSVGVGLAQQIPGVADALIDIFENNPKAYSTQPIVNASAMRTMVSPYKFGMGGEIDDDQMEQLQVMADEQGITVEELIQQLQQEQEQQGSEDIPQDMEEFALGGTTPKRTIEVEGGEVIETPQGQVAKIKGNKHEQGGVDVSVPGGTKIFSDRLKIDNKTMQERKLSRERAENRIKKLTAKNPTDKLLQGSLQRTMETNKMEEDKDMQIQNVANAIANGEVFAMGGTVGNKKYAFYSCSFNGSWDLRYIP